MLVINCQSGSYCNRYTKLHQITNQRTITSYLPYTFLPVSCEISRAVKGKVIPLRQIQNVPSAY